MRTKVTLLLLLLNVALFAWIIHARKVWDLERDLATTSRRVLPPEAADIRSLTISAPGVETPIRLELRGKDWHLASPVDWPANPHAVERILHELQLLEHKASFAVADLKNGGSLADYGLAKPSLTLTFTAGTTTPPATFTLQLGATTTADNQLYLLSTDGKRVEVVDRSLTETLRQGLDQLCSGAVFTIPVFEARALSLQAAAPSARVRLRHDDTRWTFEAPIVTRADRPATEVALGALNALHLASPPLDERAIPADRTGLATPVLRVTLEGNNRHETLLLGSPVTVPPPAANATPATPKPAATGETLRYAKLDERLPIFTVSFPDKLLETLGRAQEALRDTRVLDFDPDAVTALKLAAPGQPDLVLQRLEGSPPAWQIIRPGGAPPLPADRSLIRYLLARLALLTATPPAPQTSPFLSDAPSAPELENLGFNRPEREVTLTLALPTTSTAPTLAAPKPAGEGGTTLSLQVARAANFSLSARVVGQTFIYALPADTIGSLPVAALFYRERLVRELPEGAQITGLVLADNTDPAAPPLYSHQLAAGETWEQALHAEPAERADALTKLLLGVADKTAPSPALLRQLRANKFVRDDFTDTVLVDGVARRWKYRLDLTLALTGGAAGAPPATSTLYLAERAGLSQLAGSPEKELNVIFELTQPFSDALWKLTYNPVPPPPPAETPNSKPGISPAPLAPAAPATNVP